MSDTNLVLMDYAGRKVDTGIDLYDVRLASICIEVVSGDEIATVMLSDGDVYRFDSSDDRIMSFYDGTYVLFGKHHDNRERFLKREDSYWMFREDRHGRR